MKSIYILLTLFFPLCLSAQYTETFATANKGIIAGPCGATATSCASHDFTGVDWTITGDLSMVDTEGFFTKSGYLHSEDLDEEVCWNSPTLNIAPAAGAVSFTVDITIPSGAAWENSTSVGSIDYADVKYSVDSGPFTTIANVSGCPGSGRTISASSCASNLIGPLTYNPGASGINGNTLDIQVCFDTNASNDDGHLENVNVPEAGVVPLPVELISFRSEDMGDAVELLWITATEEDNEKFEVEHSADGETYRVVGEVAGRGTTADLQNYSFVHTTPVVGINYYRLKQIDFDGQFEHSYVINQRIGGEVNKVGEFFPNPSSTGLMNINFFNEGDKEVRFLVFDVTGKMVASSTQSLANGDNLLSLDLADLHSGLYTVRMETHGVPMYRKVMISK